MVPNQLARQSAFLETVRKIVSQRWSGAAMAQVCYNPLHEIDYCLEVATQWCFAGKSNVPTNVRIDAFVNANCPHGWFTDPDERNDEIEALKRDVQDLREKNIDLTRQLNLAKGVPR